MKKDNESREKSKYKDFPIRHIGESDVASLTLVGLRNGELKSELLSFGEDGDYTAYEVQGENVCIGEHYKLIYVFNTWMKIYDDEELICKYEADRIRVFRAGMRGCIIQLINNCDTKEVEKND